MEKKDAVFLILRYLALIAIAFPNLFIFYAVFGPLTVYPVYFILNKMYAAQLLLPPDVSIFMGDFAYLTATIFIKGYYAEIIQACVAGAAYYLLLILNLSTPMDIKKRIKSITFIFSLFLILNILRIVVFAKLFYQGYRYFDITHELTWYFGSTLLVIFVWFANVFIFKINNIPVYSDMKNLFSDVLKKPDEEAQSNWKEDEKVSEIDEAIHNLRREKLSIMDKINYSTSRLMSKLKKERK